MTSTAQYFSDIESRFGYRCTWSTIAADKTDALKLAVPNAVLYTPLKPLEEQQISSFEPMRCPKCRAFMSCKKFVLCTLVSFTLIFVLFS